MIKLLKRYIRPIWRYWFAKAEQRHQITSAYLNPEKFYDHLSGHSVGHSPDLLNHQPIFIFSAGWRSGSTLLQRLLCSDPEVLIWGEPYDRSGLIQKLASSLLPINENWPPREFFIEQADVSNIHKHWIASLYPNITDLLLAHQKFILSLFAVSNRVGKRKRWGIKAVRFGLKEALYLKLLFPEAKFVFLERDLLPAYVSYVGYSTHNWYVDWPYKPAFSAFAFARHRARLINEFKEASKIVGGIAIKYENLVHGNEELEKLQTYCGVNIDERTLQDRVGSSRRKDNKYSPPFYERLFLNAGDILQRKFLL